MDQFRKLLTKEQIFTIPNFMSLFRIVLVPFILWIYLRGMYDVAAALVAISAVTDVLDGVIARKYHMESDLGKVLDPISDKLTHAALLVCLLTRYHYIWMLLVLLVVKELTMGAIGAVAVRRAERFASAKWYGKLCTAVFEISMIALMFFPNLPEPWVKTILAVCGALMLFSLVMYILFFLRMILSRKPDGASDSPTEEKHE